VSALPVVGGPASELFNQLIGPPLQRRRDDWLRSLDERLHRLEQQGGFKLEDLGQNEAFVDAALRASTAALRTAEEGKRSALRNAILNSALPDAPDESMQQMFLASVDDFTVWHLRILKLFQNPHDWIQKHATKLPPAASGLEDVLLAAFPDLENRRPLYEWIWPDLYRAGLITTELDRTMSSLRAALLPRSSELGNESLRFIESPFDDDETQLEAPPA